MKKSQRNSPDRQEHTPRYREFERAVYDFVKALDPSATVLFDHKVPDRDTRTPRQVDVWVEAKLLGHFPVSVLVSCKAHKRKVDIAKMDAFVKEVQSAGASLGVIYSTSGFTPGALRKAKAHGLPCCRLYRDQPADIPQTLFLWNYCFQAAFIISLLEAPPTN
jgi:predicted helicase